VGPEHQFRVPLRGRFAVGDDIVLCVSLGLLLGSLDFLFSLGRQWAIEPAPVRELHAFAVATAFFGLLATALGGVATSLARIFCPQADRGLVRRVVLPGALITACVSAAYFSEGWWPEPALWQPAGAILLVSVALAIVLTPAMGLASARAGRPFRATEAGIGRLVLSGVVGVGTFTALSWTVRIRAPEMDAALLRAGLGIVSGGAWIATMFLLRTRLSRPIRGAVMIGFVAVVLGPLAWNANLPRIFLGRAGPPAGGISRIVLITIDTLRADSLSAYGSNGAPTPNIDALASSGMRFERAQAPSPWTLPSFASLMSGVSVPVHGTIDSTLSFPDEIPTLAEQLASRGYVTGGIGRSAFLVGLRGLDRGFDHYDFYPRPPDTAWGSLGARILDAVRPRHDRGDVTTSEITDLALAWMREHRSRPFFLWCHFFDPHLPYDPPPRFRPPGDPPPRVGYELASMHPIRDGEFVPTEEEKAWIRELYLGEVRYVDEEVGRLLAYLARLGPPEETLIILTSDHGEEFWEHGGFEHGHTLYQEVLHVPFIVSLPDRIPQGSDSGYVSIESMTPTILDLLDLEFDAAEFSAPSLRTLLDRGGRDYSPRPVFSTGVLYAPDGEAVVDGSTKFVRPLGEGRSRVFDLEDDPGELIDIKGENPVRDESAESMLNDWREQADALRDRLGVGEMEVIEVPPEILRELESLGYLR
jgi:arylsulfatase A-like enzyme